MQPDEGASKEMRDHVIIAGFGRVGQIIGQLLSERLIPFVALDVQAERVAVRCSFHSLDAPVIRVTVTCTMTMLQMSR